MPTVVLSGVDPSAASAADWLRLNREGDRLRSLGYECVPILIESACDDESSRRIAKRFRIMELARGDILALVPGWHRCKLSVLEIQLAQHLGLEVLESRCLCAPLPADLRTEQPKPGRLMTDAESEAGIDRLRWLRVDRQL